MFHRWKTLVLISSILLHTQADAENRALIMGIGNYPNEPLPGVQTDIKTVQKMAKLMQIPERNITVKRDADLTLQGMQKTLAEFDKMVQPGDRVLIYFSGHGRSYSKTRNQCGKALVTHDLASFDREVFQARLQPIIKRAAKTFVFLDTCFSGGIVAAGSSMTRSFNPSQARPKVFNREDDPCAEGTNVQEYRDFLVEQATHIPNYYLLGSAGPTEYAIDGGPAVGGLATAVFMRCLEAPAKTDQDHDGVVTLREVYLCAQQEVNRLLPAIYSSQTLTEGNGPGGNVPVSFGFSNPLNEQAAVDSYALMNTLVAAADATQQVTVTPSRSQYRIGQDHLEMTITSSKNGYLTLFAVGSSGKIVQLFPNHYDENNRITAHVPFHIPTIGWNLKANGPSGKDRFVAIVSNDPQRFANLGIPISPFRQLDNNARGVKEIVEVSLRANQNCSRAVPDRDFVVGSACDSGYGAGLADVLEID